MATAPKFYKSGAEDNIPLTTSFQDITEGQADESDIVALSATNPAASARVITIADASDNVLGTIALPISAGQATDKPPINILIPGFGMAGLEPNPYSGYVFFLPVGAKLRAKVDSVSGGAARIYWKRKDY